MDENALDTDTLRIPTQEDRLLRAAAVRARSEALALLVRRHRERLVWHAVSITRDPQEAHDIVQEVFLRAMREPRFFEAGFDMRAWLFRVTTNLCYNLVRDRRRRATILANAPSESLPQGRPAEAREGVWADQVQRELAQALAQLSPEHREILALRYFSDLSYAEIAARLDIKLGTVMSRLSRARARLGDLVGPEHPVLSLVVRPDAP